ncbi:MAG: amidohydrolase [Bacillota bacterium]|nr:amidohydrolase [Bacillota bacterium]
MTADLIITGGPVITVDKNNSVHRAVALKGNKILYVGSEEGVKAFQGENTQVIRLNGRTLIPGFIESHIHTAVMGVNALAVDCRPSAVSSIEDIQEAIFERAKNTPKGEWIRGWGYNDQYLKELRNPNKWDLDKVAPDNPVMLTRVCNHISAHNSRSIEIAGITDTDAYSAETFTRQNGEISGVMLEEAHMAMFKAALLKESEIVDGMVAANEMLLKEGITSIHDSGGYGPVQMRAFQNAIEQKKFKIRLYSMIFSFAENLKFVDSYLNVGIHSGMGDEHFKLGPMKLMIDGSSSGPTAATIEPYAIDSSNYGILSHSQELVDEYIMRGQQGDWQITSHAVGDKGVTVIVNAIEKAMKEYPRENCRHRIEHCAMINDELLDRIQKLRIVPICNPIFLYEFGDGYLTNYGKERAFKMFTAKSFLDRGIIAAGASDCPITFSDPLMGIHLAVNRQTQGGNVVNPDERISPMDGLRMFTYNGAYASCEEDIKGSIEVGKLADLAILNGDFAKTAPDKIWDLKVDTTIIDGKIEYERKDD